MGTSTIETANMAPTSHSDTAVLAQSGQGQGAEFIDNIHPWMPDFMAEKMSGMAGVFFAVCIIIAFLGLLAIFAGIAFKRQDGRSDETGARLLWGGGATMAMGMAVPAFQWLFSG